jgi:phosphoribosylaminoimidazolecarboxamide formyltransferase / IMP cyclohydrolase
MTSDLGNNLLKVRRALVSVSDKTGIVDFVAKLRQWNIEIISTGGTFELLREAGIALKSVSEITGSPEILEGRVKTLHPIIHASLLANPENSEHMDTLSKIAIEPIDMVVVNLYPFEKTISKTGVSLDEGIDSIDIGGPAMIRSASKNFKNKVVISNPFHYNSILEEMKNNDGCISYKTRLLLANEAFYLTSRYDSIITKYFSTLNDKDQILPEIFTLNLRKVEELRYGENPHQRAALYGDFFHYFEKLHGKELSFNNIVDIQAAVELMSEFTEPTSVIIKHTNPCGAGSDAKLIEAYRKAYKTDSKSAFGGIVAYNRPLDMETAKEVNELFTEVIVAPEIPSDVLNFMRKKKDRRLIRQLKPFSEEISLKKIAGGILVQEADNLHITIDKLRVVTKRQPTDDEYSSMLYGWRVVKHLKSNAIVVARPDRTIGVGAGQMSRVDSTSIAIQKARRAKLDTRGASLASDAFFPFADSIEEAVHAGITAIIQPGGSIRDAEVIEAADKKNIAMVFTGIRHFKH